MLPEHLSGLAQLASSGRGLTSAAAAGSIGRPVGAGGGHRAEGCKQVGHTSGMPAGCQACQAGCQAGCQARQAGTQQGPSSVTAGLDEL